MSGVDGGGGVELSPELAGIVARLPEFDAHVVRRIGRERDEYRKLYMLAREEIAQLKRGLIGQKAQRVPANDAQLSLAILELLLGDQQGTDARAETKTQSIPAHERRKPLRKPLPEELPRVTIEVVPPEVEREGLDAFTVIGVDKREVAERRPASVVVVEMIKKKFVRKSDAAATATEVFVAETPELPIPRSNVGPGFLADTIVKRWQDHLPLNRLEAVYRREGLELSRSTMCGWHMQLADLVRPLIAAMHADALQQPYLCTDATGVLVQFPERCKSGHFWVLVAPGRHVLFQFSLRHDAAAVDRLLPGYTGTVVADAHSVYDHLYGDGKATEAGCWSHTRKYVLEALVIEPERLREPMACIQALFRIEREIDRAPPLTRAHIRAERSRPLVERFFDWCARERERALEGSPLCAAIRYATNQRQALERFLAEPRLPIHNNLSELHLRRQAVGRKNWLFVGSEEGGHVNTVFVSLLASCAMHRIEPWAYLRDLLCLLPRWPVHQVLELAPVNWASTCAREDVQAKLAANVYRAATLLDG